MSSARKTRAKAPKTLDGLEKMLFDFLCKKYVQNADARQAAMGLQYTHAETHDLAEEIAEFIREEVIG